MSNSYTIDKSTGLVRLTFHGATGIEDFVTLLTELQIDPEFRPGCGILTDLRNCRLTVTYAHVLEFADYAREDSPTRNSPLAVVVDTAHETGLASLHQKKTRGHRPIEIFSDQGAAEDWLERHRVSAPSPAPADPSA